MKPFTFEDKELLDHALQHCIDEQSTMGAITPIMAVKLGKIIDKYHDVEDDSFKYVGDLVDHLTNLGRDRLLIVNFDGSTWPIRPDHFTYWDESDKYSPVALNVPTDWE